MSTLSVVWRCDGCHKKNRIDIERWSQQPTCGNCGAVLQTNHPQDIQGPTDFKQRAADSWAVSFIMPGSYTMETLPEPEDSRVSLRQVPAQTIAAIRYSGFWSQKNYQKNKEKLESWIAKMGLSIAGEPVWARYNSPFMIWFLRRNEILIPVKPEGE